MPKEALCFEDRFPRTGSKLTQGSLSGSISTSLSFELGNGKSQSMSSSFNLSSENWQKSTRPDVYRLLSCKRDTCIEKGDNICTGVAGTSGTSFGYSTTSNLCTGSTHVKNGFVYKRRKIQRNTVALLSGKNAAKVTERSVAPDFNHCSVDRHLTLPKDNFNNVPENLEDHSGDLQDNENPSFSERKNLNSDGFIFMSKTTNVKALETNHSCKNHEGLVREATRSAKGSIIKLCNSSAGNSNANSGASVMSKSHNRCAMLSAVAIDHDGHSSSSFAIPSESMKDFKSPEEMCIYVLRRHGLLGGARKNSACASFESVDSCGPMFSQCRICKLPENALKMLICDDCEQAFHLSCCRPKVKKLPVDEWYCQFCFKRKRKHLLSKNMNTSSDIMCDNSEHGPISSMLKDIRPYRSRVRIGGDFQMEVLDWSVPIDNYDVYFNEPKEIDHADCCSLEGWYWSKSPKQNSIGNWLQCQDEDDDGNKCGKWRRAPFFSVQTDDWDCSCALPWDAIHADCAVPQESPTEEVHRQLKYVELVKNRLHNKLKGIDNK